jgi:hypothetical protein
MRPAKMTITLGWAVVAIGGLAWNPAAAGTSPPATGLCTVGVGVGIPRGTLIEPCEVGSSEVLGSMPTSRTTQSPPPSPAGT